MLTTTVNLPTRRAPSPQVRTRDTSLDGAAKGSAGVNSAPNVDTGVNSAPDLGEHRCRDHDDRSNSTNYREIAEHKLGLPRLQLPLPFKWPNILAWDRAKARRAGKARTALSSFNWPISNQAHV